MQHKPQTERIQADLKPDGVHVKHKNGAQHIIPLSRFLRWCLSELRKSTQ